MLVLSLTYSHKVHILKELKDERGYISIIFVQDNRIWGMDYLNRSELNSLKKL